MMNTARWHVMAMVAAWIAVSGCGGPPPAAGPDRPTSAETAKATAAAPAPTRPTTSAMPELVLGVLELPIIDRELAMWAGFLDAVAPGLGANLDLARLRSLAATSGFDLDALRLDRPGWVVILDPRRFDDPLLLVIEVADRAEVERAVAVEGDVALATRGSLAAIGSTEALAAAAGYALESLPAGPAPAAVGFEVNVGWLQAVTEELLESIDVTAGLSTNDRAAMQMLRVVHQLRRLRVGLAVDAGTATATLTVEPNPGSAMARWIGEQRPAAFRLATELPRSTLVAAGSIMFDQIWDDLIAWVRTLTPATDPAIEDIYRRWTQVFRGEQGLALRIVRGPVVLLAWEHGEASAAAPLWRSWVDHTLTMDSPGAPLTHQQDRHRDVAIEVAARANRGPATAVMAGAPLESWAQVATAVTAERLLVAIADDPVPELRMHLDRRAAAPAKPPALPPPFADAAARGESYLVTVDLATLFRSTMAWLTLGSAPPATPAGSPASIGLGFRDGAAHVRIAMPASQVRALIDALP
jgi:hypothetical protein